MCMFVCDHRKNDQLMTREKKLKHFELLLVIPKRFIQTMCKENLEAVSIFHCD